MTTWVLAFLVLLAAGTIAVVAPPSRPVPRRRVVLVTAGWVILLALAALRLA